MAGDEKSIRAILDDALGREVSEGACEQLGIPPKTTYAVALVLGTLERALRGDADAFRAIVELSGPTFGADESSDAFSLAVEEGLREIARGMEGSHGIGKPSGTVE